MSETSRTIPLTSIRKAIAARMTEAKRTIPHFRLSADIDVDALLRLRAQLNEVEPQVNLSINDLLIAASATTLMAVPAINVQWAETEIHQCASADISVVIALEQGGLSTPIIRSAESKTVWEIALEVRELAARAKRGALKMNEIVGGSFSISNLGMYGIDRFDAIINPPQCAILAVGAAQPRMVVTSERQPRIATMLTATLSCDHRAIDGATGAQFLSALRSRIERPEYWPSAEVRT